MEAPHAQSGAAAQGFVAQMLRKTALVYDLRPIIHGQASYIIVQIAPARHAAFCKARKGTADINLTEYGEILYCGEGEPPEALKAELRTRFGMDYPAGA